MTEGPDSLQERAARFAENFDRTFAAPAHVDDGETESLLALSLAGDAYAVRLDEVAGLHPAKALLRVPTPFPDLLGVVALGGRIMPVYSLRALLNYAPDRDPPRWLLLAGPTLALAIDGCDGHLRVPRPDILAHAGTRPFVAQTVRAPDGLRGLIGLNALRQTLHDRIGSPDHPKET